MFYMVKDSKTKGNCLKIDKQLVQTNIRQNTFILRVFNARFKNHPWRFDFESELGTVLLYIYAVHTSNKN